jgi:hypothetical protein
VQAAPFVRDGDLAELLRASEPAEGQGHSGGASSSSSSSSSSEGEDDNGEGEEAEEAPAVEQRRQERQASREQERREEGERREEAARQERQAGVDAEAAKLAQLLAQERAAPPVGSPGQSTIAAALGWRRCAQQLQRQGGELPRRQAPPPALQGSSKAPQLDAAEVQRLAGGAVLPNVEPLAALLRALCSPGEVSRGCPGWRRGRGVLGANALAGGCHGQGRHLNKLSPAHDRVPEAGPPFSPPHPLPAPLSPPPTPPPSHTHPPAAARRRSGAAGRPAAHVLPGAAHLGLAPGGLQAARPGRQAGAACSRCPAPPTLCCRPRRQLFRVALPKKVLTVVPPPLCSRPPSCPPHQPQPAADPALCECGVLVLGALERCPYTPPVQRWLGLVSTRPGPTPGLTASTRVAPAQLQP